MYLRILWLHDLSERAQAAGDWVRWLAPRSDAEVLIAHALGEPLDKDEEDLALAARRAEAKAALSPLCDQLGADGIPTGMRLEAGQPLDLAERLCEQEQIGLALMGATGASGIDRVLLGSTTERLVRRLPCSVLVARSPFQRVRSVVCAVDPGHGPEPAILQAVGLARLAGAHLDFITVVEPALDLAETGPAQARLEQVLSSTLGDEHDEGWHRSVVIAETPAQGILHRADGADLVVVGTQGKRGLKRLLLGSVAETVVRSCPVSVLVAR